MNLSIKIKINFSSELMKSKFVRCPSPVRLLSMSQFSLNSLCGFLSNITCRLSLAICPDSFEFLKKNLVNLLTFPTFSRFSPFLHIVNNVPHGSKTFKPICSFKSVWKYYTLFLNLFLYDPRKGTVVDFETLRISILMILFRFSLT